MRPHVIPICLLAMACNTGMMVPGGAQSPAPSTEPIKVPELPAPRPHPTLRIFECDGKHCHQVFRVSADSGGKFFLEGEHERNTQLAFESPEALIFLDPIGSPVQMDADGGPVTVTPFKYVHHIGKAGTFHVIMRRTICAGKLCDYLARDQQMPPEFAAEFYVSATKAWYPALH